MTNSNTVVVLPAFETAPQKNMTLAHQLADTAAMMNKAQLGRLVQKKLIYQFALYLFRQVRVLHPRDNQHSSGCRACRSGTGGTGVLQHEAPIAQQLLLEGRSAHLCSTACAHPAHISLGF
jgi:hypothetical protein